MQSRGICASVGITPSHISDVVYQAVLSRMGTSTAFSRGVHTKYLNLGYTFSYKLKKSKITHGLIESFTFKIMLILYLCYNLSTVFIIL